MTSPELPDRGTSEGVLSWIERRFGVAASVDLTPIGSSSETPPGAGEVEGAADVPLGRRYKVTGLLGRGGMGVVLRATDQDLRREVAVKAVRLRDDVGPEARSRLAPLLLERFLSEAQITAQLEHPSVVPVHELGVSADGQVYYTMKVVKGRTLKRVIEELNDGVEETVREFTVGRRLQVIQKVCDALAFAHARKVAHRDLKPENVMVGRFGEVLVMDWGLAKQLDRPLGSAAPAEAPVPAHTEVRSVRDELGSPSLVGQVMGSPQYMAPEQARGDGDAIDAQTDVFGVGAILYELLSGNPPYAGATRKEIQARASLGLLNDPEMKKARRPVPKELRGICAKALASDKRERYGSVARLSADVEAYLAGRQGTAWRDGVVTRLAKLARRYPARVTGVVAAAVFVLLGFIAHAEHRVGQLERERREALEQEARDRRFTSQLMFLRSAGSGRSVTNQDDGLASVARDYLEAFRRNGLPLDDERPVAAVAEDVAALGRRSDALERSVIEAIYDLAMQMLRCHVALASEMAGGRKGPSLDADMVARHRRIAEREPALMAFWPRLRAILDGIERDPWRRGVWEACLDYWFADDRRLAAMNDLAAVEGRSAVDIEWLAHMMYDVTGVPATIPMVEKALELRPDLFFAHFQRGFAAMKTGDFDEATVHFRVNAALKPDASWAYINLGAALSDAGRLDEAIEASEKAVALAPDEATAYVNLGTSLARQGKYSEAAAAFRRSIELEPTIAAAHDNLAGVLERLGDDAEALVQARRAAELEPARSIYWFRIGVVSGKLGDLDAATVAYDRVLTLDPRYARAAARRIAELWQARGRLDELIRARTAGPEARANHLVAIAACEGKGDPAALAAACRRALASGVDDHEVRVSLAEALVFTGELRAAEAEIRRALEIQPADPEAHAALGDVLAARERDDEAMEAYVDSLRLDSDQPAVLYRIARLLVARSGRSLLASAR